MTHHNNKPLGTIPSEIITPEVALKRAINHLEELGTLIKNVNFTEWKKLKTQRDWNRILLLADGITNLSAKFQNQLAEPSKSNMKQFVENFSNFSPDGAHPKHKDEKDFQQLKDNVNKIHTQLVSELKAA